MDNEALEVYNKFIRSSLKEAYRKTKTCYVLNCPEKTVHAHSVTNNRLLNKISDDGLVMYMSGQSKLSGGLDIVPTGRGKATTFPGFCDIHDKIFEPIDNHDYVIGSEHQEFLFALRASAKEYTVRKAVRSHIKHFIEISEQASGKSERKINGIPVLDKVHIDKLKRFMAGFNVGTNDLEKDRKFFNVNLQRKRYWKIQTLALTIKNEYPVVASSTFKLEMGPDGTVINNVLDLKSRAKPTYFSIFSQNNRTYGLISWHQRDSAQYEKLKSLLNKSDYEKKVILSNLLTAYVENFAVNPTYWENLELATKQKFDLYWGLSTLRSEIIPFLFDENYNLFY